MKTTAQDQTCKTKTKPSETELLLCIATHAQDRDHADSDDDVVNHIPASRWEVGRASLLARQQLGGRAGGGVFTAATAHASII